MINIYGFSQEKKDSNPLSLDPTESIPITINFDDEEKDVLEPKKKKQPKNVYYGIKTKKGFTKSGMGDNSVIEIFYLLKVPQKPDPYIRDIHWYDPKTQRIKVSSSFDETKGYILHGPYKKLIGGQVVEEGIFFIGSKHGRWVSLDKNDILQNKSKYYKGWPKESIVSYYDRDRKKLKEVTPVEYGKKEGNYYYFFENGQVAVRGEFKNGQKVGVWQEFYPNRRRRKKEVQYPASPYDKHFRPFILREWDEDGNLIYESVRVKS